MILNSNLCWLLFAMLLCACTTTKLIPDNNHAIEFDSYKREGRFSNDDQCLMSILKSRTKENVTTIKFSSKRYFFSETFQTTGMTGYWNFVGEPGTEFLVEKSFVKLEVSSCSLTLAQSVTRKSNRVRINEACGSLKLLRFASDDIVETAWNSKACDLMRLTDQDNANLEFSDSLNFSYQREQTQLTGYLQGRVMFEYISFLSKGENQQVLSITGAEVIIRNCSFITLDSVSTPALATLYNCAPIEVSNTTFKASADYGFLINGSRDVRFYNINSEGCVHPLAPATWTTNVNVEGMHCRESVIDAHPSFNVRYKDVTIEGGTNYWNCRALGVFLENCVFNVREDITETSLYLGLVALHPDYAFLYDEYDVYCKNVTWLHQDMQFNGLHVHKCRDFIVDSCSTHAVSTGDRIRTFKVRNSRVGRVYCSDSNFEVSHTVFDATLQGQANPKPALSCSYDGTIRIDSCQFINFDSTYLFRYIQSADTRIDINYCSITSVKGFTETSYLPAEQYIGITFDNLTSGMNIRKVFSPFSKIEYSGRARE